MNRISKKYLRKILKWQRRKRALRDAIFLEQDGKCIVPSCQETEDLHLHRCCPGKNGGKYKWHNCVLVCPKHHRMLEGYYTKGRAAVFAETITDLEQNDAQLQADFMRQVCGGEL